MVHLARLAVQELGGAGDGGAEGDADRLVSEADAEQRQLPLGALGHDRDADPGRLRGAWPGAGQDAVEADDVRRARLVVATDDRVGAQLGQVLDQVVDEAVVVVDDEDPRSARTHWLTVTSLKG